MNKLEVLESLLKDMQAKREAIKVLWMELQPEHMPAAKTIWRCYAEEGREGDFPSRTESATSTDMLNRMFYEYFGPAGPMIPSGYVGEK
jgi:hypothetical protein